MKRIFLLVCILLSINAYSQKFSLVAIMAEGMTIKADGQIIITDSLFILKTIYNNKEHVVDYDIKSSRNGITYITDGEATHNFVLNEKSGKKKRRHYSHELYLTQETSLGSVFLVYYILKQSEE